METLQLIRIGIADDQQLFLRSLAALIRNFNNFAVVVEALNGRELVTKLTVTTEMPDIILIDVNMPVMNGAETVAHLSKEYAGIKTVALSMKDDDESVISMLKAGCCAYLLKDI